MNYSRTSRAAAFAAALALTTVTAFASGLTASAAPSAPDADGDAKQTTSSADRKAATDTLAEVREVFTRKSPAKAAEVLESGGVEATLALRDLAMRYDSLSESDRESADAYLARPTDPGGDEVAGLVIDYSVPEATPVCSSDICIHYVATTDDAPSPTDTQNAAGGAGPNGIPDYVDTVLRVMTHVHDTYLGAGYREPRGDGALGGGSNLIDIYLAEIGQAGLYGYCTTDQPNPPQNAEQFYDRWAYCVLDDDYAGFPNTALENIQVTAAHEYFHATQYAYDAFEDGWFLEATATWAEDEVYDSVNDNLQYLRNSPLTAPFVPVDAFVGSGDFRGFHYGTWTFFRHLTEKYKTKQGSMPKLVLDMMKKVDGSLGAADFYSWQAVESVLKTKKTTAAKQFLNYSVANRRPQQTYDEGRANKYPTSAPAGKEKLSSKRRSAKGFTKLDHLTSATVRYLPKNLKKKKTKLKVSLDMAPKKNGSMAAITVVPKKGKAKVYSVKLNKSGNGTKAVPFSSKKVKYVEVTLANTSGKTKCFQSSSSPFSCFGIPTHDNQKQKITARVK